MQWFDLIQNALELDWVAPSSQSVPFGVPGVPSKDWQVVSIERRSKNSWQIVASTPTGLEGTWVAKQFHDTRAVECWGNITNRGDTVFRKITECLTLNISLVMPPEAGQVWVRSVNGVGLVANYFPPHDFAVVDRQLIQCQWIPTPLIITCAEDGRSSNLSLPCAIVCDEKQKQGFAIFLEWSGLWKIAFQQQEKHFKDASAATTLDIQAGLRGLHLDLKPGESLPLPRLLVTGFDGNLEAGGNALRRHIRTKITPRLGGEEFLPPTSFNHWFAFQNNFTSEMLKPAVQASAAAGLEYFCVDAAWFQGDFRNGIGNWDVIDTNKFPDGIRPFADYVESLGMKYGSWFEPEWAHKDSKLYRAHPEWFWPTPDDTPYVTPHNAIYMTPQFHLINLGLAEVRQYWLDRICEAYEKWRLRWLRWDFNQPPRPNWEYGASESQLGWRQIEHVLGFYQVLDDIIAACPDLVIEQCASGGYRIDLGTARRGHTFWMNDVIAQSDHVRAFQHGLNMVLPGNYANTNLCQFRHDYTDYDFLSHCAGGYGYSGRLDEASASEFANYRDSVARFKQFRQCLLGDYQRPTGNPRTCDEYAHVVFDGLEMEFNLPGEARSARCRGQ